MQAVTISWSQFSEVFFSFVIRNIWLFFLCSIYSCCNLFTVCKCCHLNALLWIWNLCSYFLYGTSPPFTIQPYSSLSIKMKAHSWATCKALMAQFWLDMIGLPFVTESGYNNMKWQFARACVTLTIFWMTGRAALCVSLELWVSLCVYIRVYMSTYLRLTTACTL